MTAMIMYNFGAWLAEKVANELVEAECVKVDLENRFKLVSGRTSPVYCNIRNLYTQPDKFKSIVNSLVLEVPGGYSYHTYPLNTDTCLIGGETAGIPLATMLSQHTHLPFLYVRKKAKPHGVDKNLVGNLDTVCKITDQAILVEDMVTDGGSKLDFIDKIEAEGFKVNAVVCIFAYGISFLDQKFYDKDIPLIHLTDWSYVLRTMLNKDKINQDQYQQVYRELFDEKSLEGD